MPAFVTAAVMLVLAIFGPAASAGPPAGEDYRIANELFKKQDYRRSLALYRKALAAPPPDVTAGDISSRIGDAHFRLGDYRSALAAYRSALADPRLTDKAQAQYWAGFCCFLLGRDAEAVEELLKVPQRHPESGAWCSTAYYWAGRASERMGRKDLAAEYFRRAGGSGRTPQGKYALKKAEAAKGK